ncbi:hypothetical protein ACJJTC_016655 [Scirpophaga incertulas]
MKNVLILFTIPYNYTLTYNKNTLETSNGKRQHLLPNTWVLYIHGELLSDTLTIFSLEEQFLSELADFTNDTEKHHIIANLTAGAGRARFVAQCGCSMTFDCSTLGVVYADILFEVNDSPKPKDVIISPSAGIALDTVFRISTIATIDPDFPLRYTFYCGVEFTSFILASYSDHRAVETYLPYAESGTKVWVEVCDALGACSISRNHTIFLSPGSERTVNTLITDASAHARRCELDSLRRVALSAIITYSNSKIPAAVTKFSSYLRGEIPKLTKVCIDQNREKYENMLLQLKNLDQDLWR